MTAKIEGYLVDYNKERIVVENESGFYQEPFVIECGVRRDTRNKDYLIVSIGWSEYCVRIGALVKVKIKYDEKKKCWVLKKIKGFYCFRA